MSQRKRRTIIQIDEVETNQGIEPKPVSPHEAEKKVEELPSVEWGERLNSGKAIARGGKKTGFVPGATSTNP
jgi:hypothetical protein